MSEIEKIGQLLTHERFPKSAKYDPLVRIPEPLER
jgi:hypothetical protein